MLQQIIETNNTADRQQGKKLVHIIIDSLKSGVPKGGGTKLAQLGPTLWKRRDDSLTYFIIGASKEAVEAINGRLEHLRG
ncbi:hypothetical protein [Corynebacterium falsenii]